jgi:ABC-type antimicrobial peptide transport system permease subunit
MRYRGNNVQATSAMYQALERAGADMSFVGRVNRYEAEVEALTKLTSTLTSLFVGCGAFAILLAMSGIYGLTSNAVIQRRHEIGLRRAMGATRGNILRLFLVRGGKQLAVGLAISAVLSVVLLLLISQLAQLAISELMTMGVFVVLAISAIVLVAILIAVSGAIRTEPNVALRIE